MTVGDVYHYANGTPYVETHSGPNVWVTCVECGAPAAAHLEVKFSTVRCGICFARRHELLPGQRGHLAQRAYREQLKRRG